jgi:hypothetical protein
MALCVLVAFPLRKGLMVMLPMEEIVSWFSRICLWSAYSTSEWLDQSIHRGITLEHSPIVITANLNLFRFASLRLMGFIGPSTRIVRLYSIVLRTTRFPSIAFKCDLIAINLIALLNSDPNPKFGTRYGLKCISARPVH